MTPCLRRMFLEEHKMLRYACCAVIAVLMLDGPSVLGQPNIAVVNVPQVSERYAKTADLEARFDALRAELNKQREALGAKIERTGRSLQEELKPGTDDFRARRKELAMLEAEMQYFMESEGKRIEAGLARSLRSIFDDIHSVVQTVAKEKGFDVVLAVDELPAEIPDSPNALRQQIMLQKVMYWNPRIDMTDEVVSRLNAKYQAAGGKNSLGLAKPVKAAEGLALRSAGATTPE